MSLIEVTLVVIAVASIAALRAAMRAGMWTKVGTYFILAVCLFHVGSEVVTSLASDKNGYRRLVDQEVIDRWLLVIGPAIVILTASYLLTLGRYRLVVPSSDPEALKQTAEFFNWRYCLAATAPLYLIAVQGGGFVPGVETGDSYFSAGLTTQYLALGASLTAFAYVLKTRRLILAMTVQSIAFVLLGQRLPIIAGLAVVAFLLARHDHRPDRRQVRILLLLGFLGAILLSSARLDSGRDDFAGGSGSSARLSALIGGVKGLGASSIGALADDYVYRIDGNTFPALILERQGDTVGTSTIINSVRLAVPSFVSAEKLASADEDRAEKLYIGNHVGIDTRTTDFLPTILGVSVAYYGPVGVWLFAAIYGALFGLLDRWLLRATPVRTAAAAGALMTVLYYERGFDVILVTARGVLILMAVIWVLHVSQRLLRRMRPRRPAKTPSDTLRIL